MKKILTSVLGCMILISNALAMDDSQLQPPQRGTIKRINSKVLIPPYSTPHVIN